MLRTSGSFRLLSSRLAAALLGALLVCTAAAGAQHAGELRLVDDRGEPLAAPVDACFVRDLGTDCVEVPAAADAVELRAFDLLRVEGPRHGPVTVRRGELTGDGEGAPSLAVPRKAELRVRGLEEAGEVSAALYPRDDPDPGRPAHRVDLPASGGGTGRGLAVARVPAGAWILALESRGAAPDLHRLDAPPGGEEAVTYRQRFGWSLVVGARATPYGDAEGRPVAAATVSLRPVTVGPRRHGPPSSPPARTTTTDELGLALVSGIGGEVVDLSVSHPDFVPAASPGVAGRPGGFVVHEQPLERGGALEATVRVDGVPAEGWRCALLDEASERSPRRPPPGEPLRTPEAGSAVTGVEGRCRVERLPSGIFVLRAEAPEGSGGAAERAVRIAEGATTHEELDLSPIEVSGTVTRGDRGVPGYRVEISWIDDRPGHAAGDPVAGATTGEDGQYSATLWTPGMHLVSLVDVEAAQSVEARFVDLSAGGETIDFRLAAQDLEGMVVDERGEPAPGTPIVFVWKHAGGASHTSLRSGPDGAFSVPLPSAAGTVELTARAMGGRRSETAVLAYEEGTVHPPVVLTLVEPEGIAGTLVTAGGAPVHPGGVASYPADGGPGGGTAIAFGRVAEDGSFRVETGSGEAVVVWGTGPGCPLAHAVVPASAPAPVVLTCPPSSGTLRIRFRDPQGGPVAGRQVGLAVDGRPIPSQTLASHVGMLGVSFESDRSGELTLPALPPGDYRIETFGGGVLGAQVAPGGVTELDVVLEDSR